MTAPPVIRLARAYDPVGEADGARVLVDRLWPRGRRRADLHLDEWLRDVAPSRALCDWFDHDPARWADFRASYVQELSRNPQAVARCLDWVARGPVTLVYGARDREHNQAVVLRDYLLNRINGLEDGHDRA